MNKLRKVFCILFFIIAVTRFSTNSYAEGEFKQYKFTVTALNTIEVLNNALKNKSSSIANSISSLQSKAIDFNEYVSELDQSCYLYKNDLLNISKSLKPFLNDSNDLIREISNDMSSNISSLVQNNDDAMKIVNDSARNLARIDPNLKGEIQANLNISISNIVKDINDLIKILGLDYNNSEGGKTDFVLPDAEKTALLKIIDDKFGDDFDEVMDVVSNGKKQISDNFKYDNFDLITAVGGLSISIMSNKFISLAQGDGHYYEITQNKENYDQNTSFVSQIIIQTKSEEDCENQLKNVDKQAKGYDSSWCSKSVPRLYSIFHNEPIDRWYARRVMQHRITKETFETAYVFVSRNTMKRLSITDNPVDFIGKTIFQDSGKSVDPQFSDKKYIVSPYGEVTLYYDSDKK